MLLRAAILVGFLIAGLPGRAAAGCPELLSFLASVAADVVCVDSADLTTANPATTPADNSIPGLPPFAFSPITDRSIVTDVPTPITKAVPGIQVMGRFADDPSHQARFLLRLPHDWNGRLVVAAPSGTRSEFNADLAGSDYVLQKGYAYASHNKGILNFQLTTAADPLGCRLNPASTTFVRFYANDADKPFTQWTDYMLATARLAKDALKAEYNRPPRYTYALGASNGGYVVRRAIEEGGYPPDIFSGPLSLWAVHYVSFYEVTMCQWQKRFGPSYDTYGDGLDHYDFASRIAVSDVAALLAEIAPTGKIMKPLITVAGTMDALLPADRHARAYEAAVEASRKGNDAHRHAQYRLWEIQNGNHVDSLQVFFPQLERILPHAQRALDLLVDHVERGVALPPDQCVPRGGAISASPLQPGHCPTLLAP